MKSSNIVVLVGLVVLAVAGLFVFKSKNKNEDNAAMMKKDEPSEKVDTMMPSPDDAKTVMEKEAKMEKEPENQMMDDQKLADQRMMESKGSYVPYTKSNLEAAVNNKRVLFFYANWCPICKPVDTELNAKMSEIPAGITVVRVNYSDTDTDQEEKDLAKKYGITYQHTFVQIDANGNELTKWNGGGLKEIVAKVK